MPSIIKPRAERDERRRRNARWGWAVWLSPLILFAMIALIGAATNDYPTHEDGPIECTYPYVYDDGECRMVNPEETS